MSASTFSPEPINKNSLADEIVFQVKEMIADGRLQPNQKLPTEHELCQAFSVGRTTVREALMALSALGLIRRGKHNAYVTDAVEHPLQEYYLHLMIDNYDIGQLYETRLLLEGNVAKLACQRATKEQIDKMEALTQQMRVGRLEDYVDADVACHNMIMLAANNRVMYEMYQVIRFLLKKSQMEIASEETRVLSYQQHLAIINAFREHDPEKARELMNEHIRSMIQIRGKNLGRAADSAPGSSASVSSQK